MSTNQNDKNATPMNTAKPTHKVSLYGVKCYMNDNTGEIWGCNWLWDSLITAAVAFHWMIQYFRMGEQEDEGFPLVILEEYDNA